ncbi:MAG: aminotransferase class I/II-fold pyridoxal phosphate-dependent enzyme [Proteobacteria bacterium]|nr:aminotransferase class I/II-fold pyridoxal phosphate-dependent enzyme [Pseudomonadota bacterium]
MTAALVPLAVPDVSGNEARYLQECIASTFVSSVGPFVPRFEATIAASTGAPAAVVTCSGTTALHLALVVAGVRRDDLVILPDLTFIASANAISHCGATPWLLDIDPRTWTLDPAAVAHALAAEAVKSGEELVHRPTGRRIGAILAVHTLGAPPDMDGLSGLADAHGIPLVADGAAALGATYKGRPLARMGACLTGISFNGNKTVTCGGGGAIVGTDKVLLDRARHLGATARVGGDYDHDAVGYNYRMTNVEAAIGCAQMERLPAFLDAKRRIRKRYDAAFAGRADIAGFPGCPWGESACWMSGAVLSPALAGRSADIRKRLRDAGIDARAFWKPMHLQAPYAGSPRGPVAISEGLWRRILTLPCSVALTSADQDRAIAALLAAAAVEGGAA